MDTPKYFLSSEELGFKTDDTAFIARFENNLSLEKRPLVLKARSVGWQDGLSAGGLALLAAVGIMILWPWFERLGNHHVNLFSGMHLSVSATAALFAAAALGVYLVYEEVIKA